MRFLVLLVAVVGVSWLVSLIGEAIWGEDFPTGIVGGAAAGLTAVVMLRVLNRWDEKKIKEDRDRNDVTGTAREDT